MDDKREIKIKKSEKASKLENFWFYYKWHVIISIIVVFVVIVCTAQACTREKEDLSVVYAGSDFIDAVQAEKIREVLSSVADMDIDKNGETSIAFVKYLIYSEAEIEELQNTVLPDGTKPHVDTAQNSSNHTAFTTHLQIGKSNVCFLSQDVYANLLKNNRIKPLSDIFEGNIPLHSADGYSVRLGDTDLYKYNSAMQIMGEDILICMLRRNEMMTDEEQYNSDIQMFKNILNYKIAE